jgi:hypothetical protein
MVETKLTDGREIRKTGKKMLNSGNEPKVLLKTNELG